MKEYKLYAETQDISYKASVIPLTAFVWSSVIFYLFSGR